MIPSGDKSAAVSSASGAAHHAGRSAEASDTVSCAPEADSSMANASLSCSTAERSFSCAPAGKQTTADASRDTQGGSCRPRPGQAEKGMPCSSSARKRRTSREMAFPCPGGYLRRNGLPEGRRPSAYRRSSPLEPLRSPRALSAPPPDRRSFRRGTPVAAVVQIDQVLLRIAAVSKPGGAGEIFLLGGGEQDLQRRMRQAVVLRTDSASATPIPSSAPVLCGRWY